MDIEAAAAALEEHMRLGDNVHGAALLKISWSTYDIRFRESAPAVWPLGLEDRALSILQDTIFIISRADRNNNRTDVCASAPRMFDQRLCYLDDMEDDIFHLSFGWQIGRLGVRRVSTAKNCLELYYRT